MKTYLELCGTARSGARPRHLTHQTWVRGAGKMRNTRDSISGRQGTGRVILGMSPEHGRDGQRRLAGHGGRAGLGHSGALWLVGRFYCRAMRHSLKEGFFSEKGGGEGKLGGGLQGEEEKFGEGGGVAFMAPERLRSARQPARRTLPCKQVAFVVSQTGLN